MMQARWSSTCVKCGEPIPISADIKRRFVRTGMKPNGRPEFTMTNDYIHKDCKAKKMVVDPSTGEIIG